MDDSGQVFYPHSRVAFRNIAGSMVLVHTLDNRLLTLNETATAIWERLDGRSMSEIAVDIHKLFEVELEEAVEDTKAFLGYLNDRGFVQTRSRKT